MASTELDAANLLQFGNGVWIAKRTMASIVKDSTRRRFSKIERKQEF